jgi:hypothetical protein
MGVEQNLPLTVEEGDLIAEVNLPGEPPVAFHDHGA